MSNVECGAACAESNCTPILVSDTENEGARGLAHQQHVRKQKFVAISVLAIMAMAILAFFTLHQGKSAVEPKIESQGTFLGAEKIGNQVVLEGNTPWVKGWETETCEQACGRANLLCHESSEGWPASEQVLKNIAGKLGYKCIIFTSAESIFDPSASGPYCSWGPWKPKNVWGPWNSTNVRSCIARPPSATIRFCQCQKREDAAQNPCAPCSGEPDPLLKDWPSMPKDERYWGSTTSTQDVGVEMSAWCQIGLPPKWKLPSLWKHNAPQTKVSVQVLSYNLFWWNLFVKRKGNFGSAGKLISATGNPHPYEIMGFQECKDPKRVLTDGNLLSEYTVSQGSHDLCMAYRTSNWIMLEHGEKEVAEDGKWVKNNYWGKRVAIWMRLRHKTSGLTLFFMNHHGPLPLNSGGACGGYATAFNLLKLIRESAHKGDAIIVVGDFNADGKSLTVNQLSGKLNRIYSGNKFGGVDNIFSNVDHSRAVWTQNLGKGGSDHDALKAVFELGKF